MIEFWVVEVGGDAKVAEVSTHRVKLALQPRLPGGGKVWVPYVTPASSAAPSGSPARSTIRASRSVLAAVLGAMVEAVRISRGPAGEAERLARATDAPSTRPRPTSTSSAP